MQDRIPEKQKPCHRLSIGNPTIRGSRLHAFTPTLVFGGVWKFSIRRKAIFTNRTW